MTTPPGTIVAPPFLDAEIPVLDRYRQAVAFCTVGMTCTLAYVGLYLLLRGPVGNQPANAIAMLITAVTNTAGNRRYTFGRRGRAGLVRQHAQGLVIFGLGLLVSGAALELVHRVDVHPGATGELATLMSANLLATAVRFVLLRSWVFGLADRVDRVDLRTWLNG